MEMMGPKNPGQDRDQQDQLILQKRIREGDPERYPRSPKTPPTWKVNEAGWTTFLTRPSHAERAEKRETGQRQNGQGPRRGQEFQTNWSEKEKEKKRGRKRATAATTLESGGHKTP